jgi:hypothetical protein
MAAIATLGYGYYASKYGISALDLKSEDCQLIAKGMVLGALHETHLDDIMKCIDKPDDVIKNVKSGIQHFEKQTYEDTATGLLELGVAFADVSRGIIYCDPTITKREVEIIMRMINNFKDPASLSIAARKNLWVNGISIGREMSAAYTNYKEKEYEGFGRDVGVALALVFVGSSDSSSANNGARKSAMTMIENNLYPTGLEGDDNSAYISYLDALLTEEEQAK